MLSPKQFLFVFIIVLAAGNLIVTLARSGIPYELTGTVTEVEVVNEKVSGIDDVWLVHVDDESIHLDIGVAARLEQGDRLDKPRWGTHIGFSDDEDVQLRPSRDFWGMWPTLFVLIGSLVYLEKKRGARADPP